MSNTMQHRVRAATSRSMRFLFPPLVLALLLMPIDLLLTYRAIQGGIPLAQAIYYLPMLALIGPVLEVPAMALMRRFGPRRVLAVGMAVAGVACGLTGLASDPVQFFVLRGIGTVAQAPLVPGAVLVIGSWAPGQVRTGLLSWLAATVVLAPVLAALGWAFGGPLLTAGPAFLSIGAAWLIAAGMCWKMLADAPEEARWLNDGMRGALGLSRAVERAERRPAGRWDLRLPILAAISFGLAVSMAAAAQWTGGLLRESTTPRGWFDLILALIAALGVVAWSRAVDRSGRVAGGLVLATGLAAMGFAATVLQGPMWQKIAGLVAHAAGVTAARCMVWSLFMRMRGRGQGAIGQGAIGQGAIGLGVIEAAGRIGLLGGPLVVPLLAQTTESLRVAFFGILLLLVAVMLAAAWLRRYSGWE